MDSLELLSFPSPARVEGAPIAPDPTVRAAAGPDGEFAALLARIGSAVDAGEALVERATTGPPLSDPATLIALQAGIYRYAETIELCAKAVEGASGAIRTTLQSS